MPIRIKGVAQLRGVEVEIGAGLTVITGVSGSGKTSLAFDTLYHEARRRFQDVFSLGSVATRLAPANVEEITGLGPAVAVGQNLLNRNPASTLLLLHQGCIFPAPVLSSFGERLCRDCAPPLALYSEDGLSSRSPCCKENPVSLLARSCGKSRQPRHVTGAVARPGVGRENHPGWQALGRGGALSG
jgi:excinuclease UvrABC ATPase subunit